MSIGNEENNYINGQGREPYAKHKLGLTSFSHAGCGPIATYNALLSLGAKADIDAITKYYERHFGVSFGGYMGVRAVSIAAYFKKLGYKVKVNLFPSIKKSERLIKEHAANIFMYYFGSGAHYISVEYKEDNSACFCVYNASNLSSSSLTIKSLDTIKNKHKVFIPLALICVDKKEKSL